MSDIVPRPTVSGTNLRIDDLEQTVALDRAAWAGDFDDLGARLGQLEQLLSGGAYVVLPSAVLVTALAVPPPPNKRSTTMKLGTYWKAILAALPLVVTVITEVVQAIDNGSADGTFSHQDLVTVVVTALTPLLVYAKANKPDADPTTSTPDL